jgi:hypothetical protein
VRNTKFENWEFRTSGIYELRNLGKVCEMKDEAVKFDMRLRNVGSGIVIQDFRNLGFRNVGILEEKLRTATLLTGFTDHVIVIIYNRVRPQKDEEIGRETIRIVWS